MLDKMKEILLITLAMAALAGCSKSNEWQSKDFTHTGCATDTRSGFDNENPSLLTLKHEDGDLRVTHSNAVLNCAFKERGLVCNVRVEGNDIYYSVDYERQEDMEANCICRVEKMSSAVPDLEEGKEYTLHYRVLYYGYKPITFKFSKHFHQILDLDEWRDIVIVE